MCYNFIARDYSRSTVQIKQTHTHTLPVTWWLHWLGRECVLMSMCGGDWEQKCISVLVHILGMCFKSIVEYVCVRVCLCSCVFGHAQEYMRFLS